MVKLSQLPTTAFVEMHERNVEEIRVRFARIYSNQLGILPPFALAAPEPILDGISDPLDDLLQESSWEQISAFDANSSLGELALIYLCHCPPDKWSSAIAVVRSLAAVVTDALREIDRRPQRRRRTRDWEHFFRVLALPAELLNLETIEKFQFHRLRPVMDLSETDRQRISVITTTKSTIDSARSMFRNRYHLYPQPPKNLWEFLDAEVVPPAYQRHVAPELEKWNQFVNTLEQQFSQTNFEAYLIIVSILHAGMREGETVNANRSWLSDSTVTGPCLVVGREWNSDTKSKRSRRSPILSEQWKLLENVSRRRTHLIAADESTRVAATHDAEKFVRTHLFPNAHRPIYELRRIYASAHFFSTGRLDATMEALGHRSGTTTLRHYVLENFSADYLPAWKCVGTALRSGCGTFRRGAETKPLRFATR